MLPLQAVRGVAMDVQQFQRFYQEKFGSIYRYVYRKVGNREDTEDLTSEIFLKAVHGMNQELSPQSMHKWLFLIARTTVADYWRIHYRLPENSLDALLETGWEGPAEEEPTIVAINSGSTDRVQCLLQALPEHYREVLICRFLLNLSIKTTAERMGLTVANVKVLQFRALKRAANLEQVVVERQLRTS
jgi:RNA polymerase sigma-70 factor, ECF subfamily